MVHVLVADAATAAAIAASFEEEGVPLQVGVRSGSALALGREAARDAPAGIGVGGDRDRLVVVLAAAPGAAYITVDPGAGRLVGTAAARLAARRPLPRQLPFTVP